MSESSSARSHDSKPDDEQVSGASARRASLPHLLGGRYRPLRVIGRGGMGVVYAAEHIRTGEHFALKVISTKGGVGATTIERFKREARLPAQIKSEHINRVIDADVAPEIGALFLVMELLEGSDFDRLSEGKPQLPRSVVDWFAQIARGLEKAHAIGVVHRDLKPENLFLTRREDGSELVKILDFGLAKLSFQGEPGANATETGNVVGTPRYMSPEQAMGDVSHIGPAADVWALGLCAFRLLTGRHYWPGAQVAQLLGQIVYGPMPFPSACGADFGAAFDRWFQRSCDRNQHARWPVAEQSEALAAALAGARALNADSAILRMGAESTLEVTPSDNAAPAASIMDAASASLPAAGRSGDAVRSPEASRTGTTLAQFRVGEELGRGGMGIVYAAEDSKLRRRVALKVLPESFASDEERRRRFLREARTASAITHPNIATIFDVGEVDGCVYIAMELLEGQTLRARLLAGKLEVSEALRIGGEILRGLARAHEAGIVHRDLKPDNVMLGPDGLVKILDFGLAKPIGASRPAADTGNDLATEEGRILGTPSYMSPEQAKGRSVDARSDIFSFGVVLYEMLAGTRPFKADNTLELLIAIDRDPPIPLSGNVAVPRALERVVERCLAKSPDDRFTSCRDVLAGLGALGSTPSPRRWVVPVLAVVVAIAALVALASRERQSKAQDQPPPVVRESTDSQVRVDQSTPTSGSPPDPAAETPAASSPPSKQSTPRARTAPPRGLPAKAATATVTRDPLVDQK